MNKLICKNKKASHEFHLSDTFEAGIELLGSEVKSIRDSRVNLTEGWVDIQGEEAFLKDVHIGTYNFANRNNHEPTRPRKLLLRKLQIFKLMNYIEAKGYTIVPTQLYFKDNLIKVEIALAKGKKFYDKREDKKAKDQNKEMMRVVKNYSHKDHSND